MRFLVDNQLPAALARWLAKQGADAVHVLDLGLGAVSDTEIWSHGITEARIVVSKDEDFFDLANRLSDKGQLLWVRMGNCRTATLLGRFESAWPGIQESFEAGHRIVMLP